MSTEPNLTEQDYELLSAFIDGMLEDEERKALQARLMQEPLLRQELTALRQTIAIVKQLPTLKAPRNFTLTAAMVAKEAQATTTESTAEPAFQVLPPVQPQPAVPALAADVQPEAVPPSTRRIVPYPALSLLSGVAAIALMALGFLLLFTSVDGDTAFAPADTMSVMRSGVDLTLTSVASNPLAQIQVTALPATLDELFETVTVEAPPELSAIQTSAAQAVLPEQTFTQQAGPSRTATPAFYDPPDRCLIPGSADCFDAPGFVELTATRLAEAQPSFTATAIEPLAPAPTSLPPTGGDVEPVPFAQESEDPLPSIGEAPSDYGDEYYDSESYDYEYDSEGYYYGDEYGNDEYGYDGYDDFAYGDEAEATEEAAAEAEAAEPSPTSEPTQAPTATARRTATVTASPSPEPTLIPTGIGGGAEPEAGAADAADAERNLTEATEEAEIAIAATPLQEFAPPALLPLPETDITQVTDDDDDTLTTDLIAVGAITSGIVLLFIAVVFGILAIRRRRA